MYARIMLLLVAFSMGIHATSQQNIPQVTIVLVLDQFALHQYRKVRTFLNGGINFLTKNGTSCMEAYYPHARPATATGHAALSTGAYAKDHGIIANSWITPEGTTVVSTEDTPYNAAIFSPDGKTYNSGASSRNILAETLSDSFMKTHRENGIVFGISLKDRAAIPMAGKLGKAIWFDGQSGRFTSSKAYFSTLPEWLRKFNDDSDIDELTHTEWKQRFTEQSGAYSFASISDYSHAGLPMSLVNTRHPFPSDKKSRYSLYIKTPDANQAVLNVAKAALSEYKKKDPGKQLLLWVSMSSLDYAGHVYGPDSKEAIDIIYQVDAQLEKFITHVENLFGKSNIFWAFTSDHGIMPIPEVARKQGNTQAKRIDSNALIKKLNEHAKKHYGLDNLVVEFEIPNIYFKHSVFSTLSTEKKEIDTERL